MIKMARLTLLFLGFLGLMPPAVANAQTFAAAGTRAQGMGGAFVGVADDGTAIYWNPAGLAAGSYFSLVVDGGGADATPDGLLGGNNSSFLIGLSTPALGLGYYRLRAASVVPPLTLVPVDEALSNRNLSGVAPLRVDSLVTHHAGVTLVQSIVQGVAIGTTLKMVRGIAASSLVDAETADAALASDVAEILGKPSNKFDLDIGLMAAGGPLKVGITVRNVREPKFQSADGGPALTLERQARAGFSYAVASNWVAAADFDLLRSRDAFGERRDIAVGVEGRLASRAFVRSGISLNTLDDDPDIEDSRGLAYSLGGSFAAKASVFIDGHLTAGGDRTGLRWGLAARFVY